MSAINGFVRSDAAFLMADGLSYIGGLPDATLLNKTNKLYGVNAVVASTGPAAFGEWLAGRLAYRSFDELVELADLQIKHFFERYAREYRENDMVSCVALAGWHEREQRPAIYVIDLETTGSPVATRIAEQDKHGGKYAVSDLTETSVFSVPCPTKLEFANAGYDLCADLERVDPAEYLLHAMEIQRQTQFGGRHVVGGQAVLTTVTAEGVTQRVVHRWEEDKAGEPIKPRPIDWEVWREKRATAGMSWLQRQRYLKKMKKAA